MKRELATERLLLRAWHESDAARLYVLAKNPRIGQMAGWSAHQSEEESKAIIRNVFAFPNIFAITLKENGKLIGCIGIQQESNIELSAGEAEIGYWLGIDYWGKGYMPEALQCLTEYAFRELGLETLWCGCYEDNGQSAKVQEKCGFKYHHTTYDTPALDGGHRTEIWRYLSQISH